MATSGKGGMRLVAVNFSPANSRDWDGVMGALVTGAEAAGASAEICQVYDTSAADGTCLPARCRVITEAREIEDLLRRIAAADHIILGVAGQDIVEGKLFRDFVDRVYQGVNWVPLSECMNLPDALFGSKGKASLKDVCFPADPRKRGETRRALLAVQPPSDVPDHGDPFCEKHFHVLEEVSRLLGFTPAGRILSTGLFYPSLAENPVLQDQALELGRRLVTGGAIAGMEPNRQGRDGR